MANLLPAIDDAASKVANGNKVKPTSPVPCYMLELPWEVRNRILRYLLYSDEPLRLLERGLDDDENESEDDEDGAEADESEDDENQSCDGEDDKDDQSEEQTDEVDPKEGYYKNYAFSSQVMRTCRQLYDEGKLVLDSNTVGIDLCRYSSVGWQWAVAGYRQGACNLTGMRLEEKVKMMFHQTEKFHIFMDLGDFDKFLPDGDTWRRKHMHYPVPQLCRRLVEKQNLKQCRIDISIEKSNLSREADFIFLVSFHVLRCKEFSISGWTKTKNNARRLERAILADEPVRDLWAMQDALQKPLNLFAFYSGDIHDVVQRRDHITEVVVWSDVQVFLKLRSSLLEAIDNYQAKKKRELLELDFACKALLQEEKK